MRNLIKSANLNNSLALLLLGASFSYSYASECDDSAIPVTTEINTYYDSKISEYNEIITEYGENILLKIEIDRNTVKWPAKDIVKYLNQLKTNELNQVYTSTNQCNDELDKMEKELLAHTIINPIGEVIYQQTYSIILDPLGAGGENNDIRKLVERTISPHKGVIAIGKEAIRTPGNIKKIGRSTERKIRHTRKKIFGF